MTSISKRKPQAASAAMQVPDTDTPSAIKLEQNQALEGGVKAVSGVVRFASLSEVKEYLEWSLRTYWREHERATEFVGSMYRVLAAKGSQNKATNLWEKVGSFFVDSVDSARGRMEIALQFLADIKPVLAKTEAALEDFNHLEELGMPPGSAYLLFLRNGTPERLIVDTASDTEKFSFSGEFLTA